MWAAILCICGWGLLTACSSSDDDDDKQETTLPIGQWIYEGKGLLSEYYDATVLEFAEPNYFRLLGRLAADGKWYDYPLTGTYHIEARTATTGTITFQDKTFGTTIYKLSDNTLTLTVGRDNYTFTRTSGIRSEGMAP